MNETVYKQFALAYVRLQAATSAWKEAIPHGDASARKAAHAGLMAAKKGFVEAEQHLMDLFHEISKPEGAHLTQEEPPW